MMKNGTQANSNNPPLCTFSVPHSRSSEVCVWESWEWNAVKQPFTKLNIQQQNAHYNNLYGWIYRVLCVECVDYMQCTEHIFRLQAYKWKKKYHRYKITMNVYGLRLLLCRVMRRFSVGLDFLISEFNYFFRQFYSLNGLCFISGKKMLRNFRFSDFCLKIQNLKWKADVIRSLDQRCRHRLPVK